MIYLVIIIILCHTFYRGVRVFALYNKKIAGTYDPSKRAPGEILICMFLPWGLKIKEGGRIFWRNYPWLKNLYTSLLLISQPSVFIPSCMVQKRIKKG